MKLLIPFLFTFVTCSYAESTTYYISNKGKDSHDGKSKVSAWSSLQKLSDSAHGLQAGDSILLERGGSFKGQLHIVNSDIYVGAYGIGNNPIITGSIEIKNWVLIKKNTWRAVCIDCADEPGDLFLNKIVQSLGRYPNTGYLAFTSSTFSQPSVTDTTLQFADGFWNKATLIVKSSRWTLDNLSVTNYKNKTFTTSTAPSYPLQNGFGYFIQSHPATLDQHGEWYFNPDTKEIFLYLNTGAGPSKNLIEVSMLDVGLKAININNIVVENLLFIHQRLVGVQLKECYSAVLNNIGIHHSSGNGMEAKDCKNLRVENSRIANSNNNGVEWSNNSGGIFTNSSVSNTGIHPGRGKSGNGTHIALHITSDNVPAEPNLFQHNTIDGVGYIGIDFRTGNTQIKNNTIRNFCLIKDDGGGIYTWNNTAGNNIIEDNIVENGIGSGEGTSRPNQLFVSGIYIDDRSGRVLIKGNTISNCATSGIFLHNSKSISIYNNTLRSNGTCLALKEKGELYIKLDTFGRLGGQVNLQLLVSNNTWIAETDGSYCVYLSAKKKSDLADLGVFSSNQYCANNFRLAVAKLYTQFGICSAPEEITLSEWQQTNMNEKGATFELLKPKHDFSNYKNMIGNGTMTTNTNGWMSWPDKSMLQQDKKMLLDGASLYVITPPGNAEVLAYHEGISISKGRLYRLSFSAMSLEKTKLEFVPLMANSPWQSLADYTCFSIDSTLKTFTYYFRADKSHSKARVNFKSNTSYWIDNVSLHEIKE
jgi:parallel beta-helix repeat protein